MLQGGVFKTLVNGFYRVYGKTCGNAVAGNFIITYINVTPGAGDNLSTYNAMSMGGGGGFTCSSELMTKIGTGVSFGLTHQASALLAGQPNQCRLTIDYLGNAP
jgi:hypothetical protein